MVAVRAADGMVRMAPPPPPVLAQAASHDCHGGARCRQLLLVMWMPSSAHAGGTSMRLRHCLSTRLRNLCNNALSLHDFAESATVYTQKGIR